MDGQDDLTAAADAFARLGETDAQRKAREEAEDFADEMVREAWKRASQEAGLREDS